MYLLKFLIVRYERYPANIEEKRKTNIIADDNKPNMANRKPENRTRVTTTPTIKVVKYFIRLISALSSSGLSDWNIFVYSLTMLIK